MDETTRTTIKLSLKFASSQLTNSCDCSIWTQFGNDSLRTCEECKNRKQSHMHPHVPQKDQATLSLLVLLLKMCNKLILGCNIFFFPRVYTLVEELNLTSNWCDIVYVYPNIIKLWIENLILSKCKLLFKKNKVFFTTWIKTHLKIEDNL